MRRVAAPGRQRAPCHDARPRTRQVAPAAVIAIALTAAGAAVAAAPASSAAVERRAPPGTSGPPVPGRYAATLCVAQGAQPASCGPADLDLRAGNVRIQVSDIVYRLQLGSAPAVVVVMQGAMQIDEFASGARWDGASLHFADAEKQLRYEVRVGAPRRGAR